MFCPQCGNEIASDRVRFCTRCSFPVGPMKEFIVTEAAKIEAEEEKKFYPLRQRDITLGAGLMLIGTIKAGLIAASMPSGPPFEGFGIYLFSLSILFSAFLLLSQLSPRQRGLTLGATLMFGGALLSIPIGMATDPPGALLLPVLLIPIILFWMKLMRGFLRIFFDKDVSLEKRARIPLQPEVRPIAASTSALPPVQNASVVEIGTNRIKEEKVVAPFSVTENTTEMFKNKQPINP